MNEPKYFELAIHYSDQTTANYMVRARDAWDALTVLNAKRKIPHASKQALYVVVRVSIYDTVLE